MFSISILSMVLDFYHPSSVCVFGLGAAELAGWSASMTRLALIEISAPKVNKLCRLWALLRSSKPTMAVVVVFQLSDKADILPVETREKTFHSPLLTSSRDDHDDDHHHQHPQQPVHLYKYTRTLLGALVKSFQWANTATKSNYH